VNAVQIVEFFWYMGLHDKCVNVLESATGLKAAPLSTQAGMPTGSRQTLGQCYATSTDVDKQEPSPKQQIYQSLDQIRAELRILHDHRMYLLVSGLVLGSAGHRQVLEHHSQLLELIPTTAIERPTQTRGQMTSCWAHSKK
jgi:hypothetical protein